MTARRWSRVPRSGPFIAAALAFVAALLTPISVVAAGSFTALLAPQRLADSRPGVVTVDGLFAGGGVRASGSTLALQVTGRAGIPAITRCRNGACSRTTHGA